MKKDERVQTVQKKLTGPGDFLGNRLYLPCLFVLAVLALLHYMDARAGAVESGDLWLVSRYLLVACVSLGMAGIAGAFLLPGRLRLETVFVPVALVFGLLYMTVLPPLSAPDEIRHYISAYQLSSQILGRPATTKDGYVLVRLEDWFAEDSCGDFESFLTEEGYHATDEDGADGAKVLGQTLTEETYRLIHEKGSAMEEPGKANSEEEDSAKGNSAEGNPTGGSVNEDAVEADSAGSPAEVNSAAKDPAEELAVSVHLPVVTTPLAYLAPSLGISLARLLGLNNLWLLYLGRLCNLLLFVGGIYGAMRRLPFGKEVLFGVAVLPMSLHLAASFSYDVMILAGISLFTAECLYLAYKADRVKPGDVLFLAVVMAVAGPCKMVYAVFMGLCLLIPVRKFGGWGKWFLSACCVLGAWALAMGIVNGQTVASYVSETENFVDWAGEEGYSLTLLLHQPLRTIRMFYNTVLWQAEVYHLTMIGSYLGNLDLVLDVPYLLVMLLTACLVGLALRKPGETLILTGGKRLWIWFLCLACAGATLFSMLLALTPLSSQVISGVQGRYFLPFLPVFLMSVKNDRLVLTHDGTRGILYVMCCANAYVLYRIFSVVCMRL